MKMKICNTLENLVSSNGTQRQLLIKNILEDKYLEIFQIDLVRVGKITI